MGRKLPSTVLCWIDRGFEVSCRWRLSDQSNLILQMGQALVGRAVRTPARGEYTGAVATVIHTHHSPRRPRRWCSRLTTPHLARSGEYERVELLPQTTKQAARVVATYTLIMEDLNSHATHLPAPRSAGPRDPAHAAAGPEQEAAAEGGGMIDTSRRVFHPMALCTSQ
jgi:hypothetical protein